MADEEPKPPKSPSLRTGKKYRASVVVETTLTVPSVKTISKKLEDMGFSDLEVWNDSKDIPPDWPEEDREDKVGDELMMTQYWGHGTWAGEDEKQISTEGTGWTIVWIYAPKDSKDDPGPDPERFEQEPKSSWTRFLPALSVMATNLLAITLAVKAAREK